MEQTRPSKHKDTRGICLLDFKNTESKRATFSERSSSQEDGCQPGYGRQSARLGTIITLPSNTLADHSALLQAAQLTLLKLMTIEAMTSAIASVIRICGMFRSQTHLNRRMQGSSSRHYSPSKSVSGSYEECDIDNMGAVHLVQALGGIIPDRPETIFGDSKTSRIQEPSPSRNGRPVHRSKYRSTHFLSPKRTQCRSELHVKDTS